LTSSIFLLTYKHGLMVKILHKKNFCRWIDSLSQQYALIGPVKDREETVFQPLQSPEQLEMDYISTMAAPRKFIYPSRQLLFRFTPEGDGKLITEEILPQGQQILLAVHPCDAHAIMVLDRVLMGEFTDSYYTKQRQNTFLIVLNCQKVDKNCFCDSMGTGPFLHPWMGQDPAKGCDLELTDLGDRYLAEFLNGKIRKLFSFPLETANDEDIQLKKKREVRIKEKFVKKLNIENLPSSLRQNMDHSVWSRIGEAICLSCANCTMVCPTCYCYNTVDTVKLDLSKSERYRYWDSCQELHFAEVHGGNFRLTRGARLRQFVLHKLSYWMEQYGCFGCVGCGRCINWCPTGIDLTEIVKEIRGTKANEQYS